jgi:two-component system sensor histidine kinase QseC
MAMPVQWSLRARLLRLFLAATALAWTGSGLLIFLVAERESARQWDQSLHRAGRVLLDSARHEYRESGGSLRALEQGSLQQGDLLFQFRDAHGVLLQSPVLGGELPSGEPGEDAIITLDGRHWHMATLADAATGLRLTVAEPAADRFVDSRRLAIALAAPVLIGLPLLALLAQFFSNRALAPLREAALRLGQRAHSDLSPISANGMPREALPLVDAFNHLLERLAALIADQRRFASAVAHELRTPLASLRLELEMLGARETDQRRRLSGALGTLDRARKLIDQLLVLARLETDKTLSGATEPFDLRRLVQEVVRELALRAEERGIHVELRVPSQMLGGFEQPLYMVVRNLLENALRHAAPRGRVRIGVQAADGEWSIVVEDDGAGLMPEPDAPSRPGGQLRLGWLLVERIAAAMGGRFDKGASAELGGARLALVLPASP